MPRPAEICVNRFNLLLSKAGKPSDSLLSPGVLAFGLPHTRQQAVAFVTWELTPCYPSGVSPVNCHHHLGLSRLAVRPMNFHTSTLSVKLCLFSKLDSGLTSLAQPLPSSGLHVWRVAYELSLPSPTVPGVIQSRS